MAVSTPVAVEYSNPVKLDVEGLTAAVITGVIIGLINKYTNGNLLLQIGIGAAMFFLGPVGAFGGFIKLAGLGLIAEGIYGYLRQNITITPS